MRTQTAMSMDGEIILEHFRQRRGQGRGKYLDNLVYHLMRMILEGEEFGCLESLITFCRLPENLSRWLPTEADRMVFSGSLAQGLLEMSPDSACNLSSKSEVRLSTAATRRSVQQAGRTVF